MNKAANKKLLSIAQGIHQLADPTSQLAEVTSAFQGAQAANAIFPNTVWALTVNWEDIFSVQEGIKVSQMINTIKSHPEFQASNLKIGARTQNCETALDPNNQHADIVAILTQLVRDSDYLMCNLYPDYTTSMQSVESAVNSVSNTYSKLNDMVKSVNPKCDLIVGETGWPSEGVAFNGSPSTVSNMAKFWELVGQKAATHGVKVVMFEAIDEPWKSDRRNRDPRDANGFNGGEGHYGWWVQRNNSDSCSFFEKATGLTVKIVWKSLIEMKSLNKESLWNVTSFENGNKFSLMMHCVSEVGEVVHKS